MSQYTLLQDDIQETWEDVYESIYDTEDENCVVADVTDFEFTYIDSESHE